jgi:transcriptional regulator with XRE-family HTH domain
VTIAPSAPEERTTRVSPSAARCRTDAVTAADDCLSPLRYGLVGVYVGTLPLFLHSFRHVARMRKLWSSGTDAGTWPYPILLSACHSSTGQDFDELPCAGFVDGERLRYVESASVGVVGGLAWSALTDSVSPELVPAPSILYLHGHGHSTETPIELDQSKAPDTSRPPLRTHALADAIKALRADSGLTWEQLAKLLGVSRRSVHIWANGGRMTASHIERLSRLRQAVAALPGDTAEERRASLLAPSAAGVSRFDALRAEVASSEDDISGNPWGPRAIQQAGEIEDK